IAGRTRLPVRPLRQLAVQTAARPRTKDPVPAPRPRVEAAEVQLAAARAGEVRFEVADDRERDHPDDGGGRGGAAARSGAMHEAIEQRHRGDEPEEERPERETPGA